MPKQVMHSVKKEYVLGEPNASGYYRTDEVLWCGKIWRLIKNKKEVTTPERQAEFEAEQAINPTPRCKKCEAAKEKFKKSEEVKCKQ